MNLILLHPADFLADGLRVSLRGRRLEHVRTVHRAAVGDELGVGLLNGRMGSARVLAIDGHSLELEVHLESDPPAPLSCTLLLALPRPKVLKRVLITATSMGVKRIVLLNAWRVEKSFWQSPLLQPEALREPLLLGLEQARDTLLPEVLVRPRFKPFVEDELPALVRGAQALMAHPLATEPCPRAVTGGVVLAIGPEGGFIPYEIAMLEGAGFDPVTLGPRILRVEAAVPSLLGRLF